MKKNLGLLCLLISAILLECSFESSAAKKAKAVWYLVAPVESKTFEDDNVSISYSIETVNAMACSNVNKTPFPVWSIKITNKSNDIIYFDLSQCFQIINKQALSLYVPGGISFSSSFSTYANAGYVGISKRFGGTIAAGLSVGASSTQTVTNVVMNEKVIAIPPHCEFNMPDYNVLPMDKAKIFEDVAHITVIGKGQYAGEGLVSNTLLINREDTIDYGQDESPINFGFFFRYFTDSEMTNQHDITSNFYISKAIGTAYSSSPFDLYVEYETVSKVMPDWENWGESNIGIIRLWAM